MVSVSILQKVINGYSDLKELEESIAHLVKLGFEVEGYSVTVNNSYNEVHNVIMVKKEK